MNLLLITLAPPLITISPWKLGKSRGEAARTGWWKLEGEKDIKRDIISMERKINRDSINSWQEGGKKGLMCHRKFVSIIFHFCSLSFFRL